MHATWEAINREIAAERQEEREIGRTRCKAENWEKRTSTRDMRYNRKIKDIREKAREIHREKNSFVLWYCFKNYIGIGNVRVNVSKVTSHAEMLRQNAFFTKFHILSEKACSSLDQ